EFSVTAIAVSLGLELNNEKRGAYKSAGPMTFAQYLAAFDPERVLTLNINEVSDKEIANEWTGTDTVLKRLFSIASLFGAELEFK
ncbi:hypothetical protein ACPXAM_23990, partial [Escherichia coli]|uniref:hypothetical protein n=1 Tax=Escherichia coli TaxID=562 RepID=UPI003CE4AC9C